MTDLQAQAQLANVDELATGGPGIAELSVEWETYLRAEKSPTTADAYTKGLRLFLAWIAEQHLLLRDVKPSTVREWRNHLQESYSRGSTNIWLTGVRRFYAWMIEEKDAPILNVAKGIKAKGRESSRGHRRDMLTSSEILGVLETCSYSWLPPNVEKGRPDWIRGEQNSPEEGKRDRAIIGLMVYCGLRTIEIRRANFDNLETREERLVLWLHGKGAAEPDEFVVVSRKAEDCLRDWLAVRGSAPGPLFHSMSNNSRGKRLGLRALRGMVKSRYLRAGVVGQAKSTHSLRYSAITNAIRHGATPQQAQAMARHKSVDTTLGYYIDLDRLSSPAEDLIDYDNGV